MVALKRSVVAVAGALIGILTLRRLRERRRDPKEEAQTEAKKALEEAGQAAEHSAESLEHARVAGEKAIEAVSEEVSSVRSTVTERESEALPVGQSRGARGRIKRLVRR